MVRPQRRPSDAPRRSPHARGDGPRWEALPSVVEAFSPRAWGWSERRQHNHGTCHVLPTRVGMVRATAAQPRYLPRSPHARGDGPTGRGDPFPEGMFSPRAWGWSDFHYEPRPSHPVLPTRVGMVRSFVRIDPGFYRSPHARGDGPSMRSSVGTATTFSPRAWGWSARKTWPNARLRVLPTRVGMVRRTVACRFRVARSPHARGDGPGTSVLILPIAPFSPRAWGWSGAGDNREAGRRVLPTRVGMVRFAGFV